MKRISGIILLILMLILSGCGGSTSAPAGGTSSPGSQPDQNITTIPESTTNSETEQDVTGEIKTFSIEPVEAWIFLDAASNDIFKSYNLIDPYVGSANFWMKYIGTSVYDGKESSARSALELIAFTDYEFVSVDKVDSEMPTVRCITNYTSNGMNFTIGHYFIDVAGDEDIYFQLSTAPENFSEAQPLWEEALKTLTVE